MKLNTKQIITATGGQFLAEAFDTSEILEACVCGVDEIKQNYIYVTIELDHLDNKLQELSTLKNAIMRGAKAILVDRPIDEVILTEAELRGCSIILVDNLVVSLQNIAQYWIDKTSALRLAIYDTGNIATQRFYEEVSNFYNSPHCKPRQDSSISVSLAATLLHPKDKLFLMDAFDTECKNLRSVYDEFKPSWCCIVDGPDRISETDLFNIVANLKDNSSVLFINSECYNKYRSTFLSHIKERGIDLVLFGFNLTDDEDSDIAQVFIDDSQIGNFAIHCKNFSSTKNFENINTVAHISKDSYPDEIIYQITAVIAIFAKCGISLFDSIKYIKQRLKYIEW